MPVVTEVYLHPIGIPRRSETLIPLSVLFHTDTISQEQMQSMTDLLTALSNLDIAAGGKGFYPTPVKNKPTRSPNAFGARSEQEIIGGSLKHISLVNKITGRPGYKLPEDMEPEEPSFES